MENSYFGFKKNQTVHYNAQLLIFTNVSGQNKNL
jgi:hypothetical protein